MPLGRCKANLLVLRKVLEKADIVKKVLRAFITELKEKRMGNTSTRTVDACQTQLECRIQITLLKNFGDILGDIDLAAPHVHE